MNKYNKIIFYAEEVGKLRDRLEILNNMKYTNSYNDYNVLEREISKKQKQFNEAVNNLEKSIKLLTLEKSTQLRGIRWKRY